MAGEKRADSAKGRGRWYLLAVFFGIIGGLIGFAMLRKDDPKLARNVLIVGAVLTVLLIMMAVLE